MKETDYLSTEDQLRIISKAWGENQGYVFFPWIPGTCRDADERRMSWNEGPAFFWPADKAKIIRHMEAHEHDDLYWSTCVFEEKLRRQEYAMDETALWADLDEVDPRKIEEIYTPTIAWETSPGRYQALWPMASGDFPGAADRGGPNHRLTFYLGADKGGWDKTQVLRIPTRRNYKPEHRGEWGDEGAPGKLLWWHRGRNYFQDDFLELPDLPKGEITTASFDDTMDAELASINRRDAYQRYRLKLSQRVRQLILSKEASGDRSERLWEIERELADAGASPLEIVKICRETAWNKHSGRADEVQQLLTEAMKAIGEVPEDLKDRLEADIADHPHPKSLKEVIRDAKEPTWLIRNIWAEASCGFIAGEPKSYKTWFALDLALSLAGGGDFLDHFTVERLGPVLIVQEEDSAAMVRRRIRRILPGKLRDKMTYEDGQVWWVPARELDDDPLDLIDAEIRQNIILTDATWQLWLDETLAQGHSGTGQPYVAVILDPMMMLLGDVEENRSTHMTSSFYKPLKQLVDKHGCAVIVVHHMRKAGKESYGMRGGTKLLGSQAGHAWTEDALYLSRVKGEISVEHESKHDVSSTFRVSGLRTRGTWTPIVTRFDDGDDGQNAVGNSSRSSGKRSGATTNNGKRNTGGATKPDRDAQVLSILADGPKRNTDVALEGNMLKPYSLVVLRRLEKRGLTRQRADKKWELK